METNEISFFKSALDSIPDQLAIIDQSGDIVFVNQAWKDFAVDNNCQHIDEWLGINYLTVCQKSAAEKDQYSLKVIEGLNGLISGSIEEVYIEYPCHSPAEQRWFYLRAVKLNNSSQKNFYILTHHNITERVIAEKSVMDLSLLDHLTGLKNRRAFDQLFDREWRQCLRENNPISIAFIDVDYFNQFNAEYGAFAGDQCLKAISRVFQQFEKRSTDFVARYGGEKFIFVFGNTDLDGANLILLQIKNRIRNLSIPHKLSPHNQVITVSAGLSSIIPQMNLDKQIILDSTDKLLNEAKTLGRNRITREFIEPQLVDHCYH